MAYDEKTLKRDGSGITPVPQHFNPTADDYEAILGRNGASRVELYGPDGNPISTSSGKLAVRATEMETTLTQILAKIIATPATEAKQDSVITALGTLLTKTGFDAKADLALSALRDALRGTGNKTLTDLATAQAALAAAIGEAAAAPTANTILARLKSLEDKIDAITSGATPATAQLTGSIETINTNPVVGVKTVTATAASIFAGGSVKSNRRKLILRNEDPVLRFRIGPSTVTQQNGFPVEPGAVVIIPFDPAVIVPIYAISEGASLQVSVMEV